MYEHILAKNYHWNLDTIRDMDYYDFQVHLRICLVAENIENEFRLVLAGYGPKKKSSFDDIMQNATKGGGTKSGKIEQEFDPATGKFKKQKSSAQKIYQKFDPKTGRLLGE